MQICAKNGAIKFPGDNQYWAYLTYYNDHKLILCYCDCIVSEIGVKMIEKTFYVHAYYRLKCPIQKVLNVSLNPI